jgi:hypothetical protein
VKRLLIVLLGALAGCMTTGVKVDQSKVASFKPGVTTCTEAVASLGVPTNTSINSDGTKSIQYVYAHSQANAASFIPYVGIFAGGATTENTVFSMNCDRNDKLVNYSSSQGANAIGTGIVSGQKQ